MTSRSVLIVLVAVGGMLPLVLAVALGTSRILAAMEDGAAASVLDRVALAVGLVWGADLLALLLAMGIRAIETRGKD